MLTDAPARIVDATIAATRSVPEPTRSVRTFDAPQAATYLGVGVPSVSRWARSGELRGFRDRLHPGGPWRFNQQDLDAFRRSRQAPISDSTEQEES